MEHRLSHLDWQRLENGLAGLYAPGLLPSNFLSRSFAVLRSLVPSDLMVYGTARLEDKSLAIELSENCPAASVGLEGFARCMGKYELFNWSPTTNGGLPFYRGDFFSRREFHNLDIYTDCYRYFGLDNHLALHVPTEAGSTVFFGVERGGNVDFTERDRAILAKLQRHLGNARSLAIAHGELPSLSPDILIPRFRQAGFTPREAEVLYWILEGKTLAEIGIILNIRRTTAKTHLEALYKRMGVENRTGAVRRGLELVAATSLEGTGSKGVFSNIRLPRR
jgi:DNA-binding CsgD family transcriptional regulator